LWGGRGRVRDEKAETLFLRREKKGALLCPRGSKAFTARRAREKKSAGSLKEVEGKGTSLHTFDGREETAPLQARKGEERPPRIRMREKKRKEEKSRRSILGTTSRAEGRTSPVLPKKRRTKKKRRKKNLSARKKISPLEIDRSSTREGLDRGAFSLPFQKKTPKRKKIL